MSFGDRLKDLLKENNISQSTLAAAISVSQRAVSKWINHQSEPTESCIVKCANYFSVSTDYMLGVRDDY
ncbi:MAG: helix-turn-helix transcriptional regulator [Clostridiales bacterium]|nr:helix-turn-helix transcriptional regulator [Clostridiales bacterium]